MIGSIGKTFLRLCRECEEECVKQQEARDAAERAQAREKHWLSVCPGTYRETDPGHPGLAPDALRAVRDWDPPGTRGLGLIGHTGIGKTRVAFLALRKAHDHELSVMAIGHSRFCKAASEASGGGSVEGGVKDDARTTLRRAGRVDVLLLDDLGKGHSTDRANQELYDLIELRTCEGRPIIWTAQAGGQWLIDRFGRDDKGPAIVRRLAEFCVCPDLPRDHQG